MKTRILDDDRELEEFARHFQARGNPVSLDYLRRSRVRAFFDSEGGMFAGYAVNQSPPLRYVEWIPESARASAPVISTHERLCEITCIWINGKRGRVSSELIYLHSVIDALWTGADFVLGGTLSSVVYGIQSQSLPRLLYRGPTPYFGRGRVCWIYGGARRDLIRHVATTFPVALVRGLLGKPKYLAEARRRARREAAHEVEHVARQ